MPVILTIGNSDFVLPDMKQAAKIMELLQPARPCYHIGNLVAIKEAPLKLTLTTLDEKTIYARSTDEDQFGDRPDSVIVPEYRPVRGRLAAPRKLLTGGGR